MPFNLSNALVIIQIFMNDVFHEFVVYYIHDNPFSQKMWKNMNNMCDLLWTTAKKSNSTTNWKNVNFIKPN
jgi:hypothetical protein